MYSTVVIQCSLMWEDCNFGVFLTAPTDQLTNSNIISLIVPVFIFKKSLKKVLSKGAR